MHVQDADDQFSEVAEKLDLRIEPYQGRTVPAKATSVTASEAVANPLDGAGGANVMQSQI